MKGGTAPLALECVSEQYYIEHMFVYSTVCSSCKLECIVLCPIVPSCWCQSISTFNQALFQTRCFIIDTLCCLVHSASTAISLYSTPLVRQFLCLLPRTLGHYINVGSTLTRIISLLFSALFPVVYPTWSILLPTSLLSTWSTSCWILLCEFKGLLGFLLELRAQLRFMRLCF